MIRQHQLYENGPWVRLCTTIEDVIGCTLVNWAVEGEEVWMRFDTTYEFHKSERGYKPTVGTPLVLILGPDDEDEGYRPCPNGYHDFRYHLQLLARYGAKGCPYVRLGVLTEAQMQVICDMVKEADEKKQEEMERHQYEKLKAKFEPMPGPIIVKPKIRAVYRGRKEAFK